MWENFSAMLTLCIGEGLVQGGKGRKEILGADECVRPHVSCLEAGCSGGCVAVMQSYADAATCVQLRSGVPVDFVGADDAAAAADQRGGDPVVLVAVAAD